MLVYLSMIFSSVIVTFRAGSDQTPPSMLFTRPRLSLIIVFSLAAGGQHEGSEGYEQIWLDADPDPATRR